MNRLIVYTFSSSNVILINISVAYITHYYVALHMLCSLSAQSLRCAELHINRPTAGQLYI